MAEVLRMFAKMVRCFGSFTGGSVPLARGGKKRRKKAACPPRRKGGGAPCFHEMSLDCQTLPYKWRRYKNVSGRLLPLTVMVEVCQIPGFSMVSPKGGSCSSSRWKNRFEKRAGIISLSITYGAKPGGTKIGQY